MFFVVLDSCSIMYFGFWKVACLPLSDLSSGIRLLTCEGLL